MTSIVSIGQARLILAALVCLTLTGLWTQPIQRRGTQAQSDGGDAELYRTVVESLRGGDSSYDALGGELRREGYPSASVLNWRTPAHLQMLRVLSLPAASLLLKLLALVALLLVPLAFPRSSAGVLLITIGAQMGALATAFTPDAAVIADVWAGVLVALSLAMYYRSQVAAAAALGATALFFRELAALYCVACGLIALAQRRRGEIYIWLLAALSYSVYFGIHVAQVSAHFQSGDRLHAESWIRWNGAAFILATISVNGWIAFAPRWVSSLYGAIGIAGSTSSAAPPQVRLSLLFYLVLFATAGQHFNEYWGFVTAPIWAFSFSHGLVTIRDLFRTASGSPAPQPRGERDPRNTPSRSSLQ